MIQFKRQFSTKTKAALSLASAIFLSLPWEGASCITLFVGLLPLLLVSAQYSGSRRDFFAMLGWATLTFVLWNAATIWWVCQGGDQDEQATQAGGFWGSSWNMRAHQAGGSQEGHRGKQVMGEGSLGRRWWGHRSQLQLEPFLVPMDGGVSERGREAAMVVPLLACHSTVKVKALHFHFYGCPCGGFPHAHVKAVSSKPTAIPFPDLHSKLLVPAPSPCAHWWTPVSGWGA